MRTWMDHVGNVHGRVDGANASAPALLLGSHYDTVYDAGKFDGALGIIVGAGSDPTSVARTRSDPRCSP